MHRAAVLVVLFGWGCSGDAESEAGYACELDGQCQYSFDLESNPNKQDAAALEAHCDGLGGEFSEGTCARAIAKCVYSGQRERHFYEGFAGFNYRTHADFEALNVACQLENGSLEVLEQPCSVDADCDDGLMCTGVERCVVQEVCTSFCTQASCEPGEPACGANETCEPATDACVPR